MKAVSVETKARPDGFDTNTKTKTETDGFKSKNKTREKVQFEGTKPKSTSGIKSFGEKILFDLSNSDNPNLRALAEQYKAEGITPENKNKLRKAVMKEVHPDKGGSTELTQKYLYYFDNIDKPYTKDMFSGSTTKNSVDVKQKTKSETKNQSTQTTQQKTHEGTKTKTSTESKSQSTQTTQQKTQAGSNPQTASKQKFQNNVNANSENLKNSANSNIIDLSKIDVPEAYVSRYKSIISYYNGNEYKFDYSNDKKYFESLKNLSVDESSKLGDYTKNPYDMPLKFMTSVNEQLAKTGSSLIVDEVPKMFEGIDSKELGKAIDNLSLCLDNKKSNIFTIGGKEYTAERIGGGAIGTVYKISDANGNSVAVKYYHDPTLTGLQGAYAEIPITREASKAGVVDVAKFYMANPCGTMTKMSKNDPDFESMSRIIAGGKINGWQIRVS